MKTMPKILLCLFCYLLFGLMLAALTHKPGRLFFVWNVFLAFLPLLFSRLLHIYVNKGQRRGLVIGALLILWLLFFPNAPYMVTDLIHFNNDHYYTAEGYTTSMTAWAYLVYLAGGVMFGVTMGLFSLYEVHGIFQKFMSKKAAHALVAACCLLSGFAIYLGRILRFNSWDVLHPIHLLTRLQDELGSFSVLFSLLFAVFIFGGYLIFYLLLQGLGSKPAGKAVLDN
jgi:uncharacterized membrane protein